MKSADSKEFMEANARTDALRRLIGEVRTLVLGWDNLGEEASVRQAIQRAEKAISDKNASLIDAMGQELFDLKKYLQAKLDN